MTRQTWSLASELATNRRQFILSGASLAVLPWLGGMTLGQSRENPTFKSDPFTLGVASGDPSPDGMVLWTRLAPEPLAEDGGLPGEIYPVRWEIASDDAMQDIVKKGTALATPQLAHSVHVEVSGLEPDRWYWYRFSCGDAQTVVGRTRTTPRRSAKPDQLRFAFASCQHYESGLYTAYEHMAKEDLDLILHLGDYIYEGAARENNVRQHNSREIETLAEYRARLALYHTDEHLQAAHALCPWLVVWDDHEVDNNYATDISEQKGVEPRDLLLRRANAYQAYYENMPLRARSMPKGPDMKIFRRIPYGRLAQFDMLDTRQYRSDQPNNDKAGPLAGDVFNPDATLLGDAQEKWLMAGMLRSTSNWNILGQQVMMGRANRGAEDQDRFSMDQWSGYDVPRSRLLKFIAERRIPNPVVLTGDIHKNWVNDLQVDFDNESDPVVATEFVGTSISSSGNGIEKPREHESVMSRNPFVKFFNGERGYVSCTVTPKEWKSDYQVVEYIDKPGAPLVTRASFVVESNKPGAQQA
ncbi:MAG: alkaline phosphatase D family protein [Pirellulaceae bacterium]